MLSEKEKNTVPVAVFLLVFCTLFLIKAYFPDASYSVGSGRSDWKEPVPVSGEYWRDYVVFYAGFESEAEAAAFADNLRSSGQGLGIAYFNPGVVFYGAGYAATAGTAPNVLEAAVLGRTLTEKNLLRTFATARLKKKER